MKISKFTIAMMVFFVYQWYVSPLLFAGSPLAIEEEIHTISTNVSKETDITAEIARNSHLNKKLNTIRVEMIEMQKRQNEVIDELRSIKNSIEDGNFITQYIIPILGFIGVIITIWWSVRQFKITYFTRDWASLIEFLSQNPEFMDQSKTVDYSAHFKGNDLVKYEMVARRCLGFLDDMYFMNSKRFFNKWFKGSIKLLAGRHKPWLKHNEGAYDKGFLDFIYRCLEAN